MAGTRHAGSKVSRWVFPAALAVVAIIGVTAVVLTASSGSSGSSDRSASPARPVTEVSAEVSVTGPALPAYTGRGTDPAVGRAAPRIGSVAFDGTSVEVGGATGSPYALVFVAHWCPHCQAEVPRIVELSSKGTVEGLDVTAVVTGTSAQSPNYPPSRWLERERWPLGVLVDDASGAAAKAYGLAGYPFIVFVDADGKVAGRVAGEVPTAALRALFGALAAGEALPLPDAGAASRR